MTRKLPILCTAFIVLMEGGATAPPAKAPQHVLKDGRTYRPRTLIRAQGVNGVFLISGRVVRARIGPARIVGAYRAVESDKRARPERLVIDGLVATELERDGIRLRRVDGATISNFAFSMRAKPQTGSHLPQGIAVYAGRNVTIRDGKVSGFRMIGKGYLNGDGIAVERGVDGLLIERVHASDNSDGGFDIKSKNTRIDQTVAERNGVNYRFWGDIKAGYIVSRNARQAHVGLYKGGNIQIEELVVESSTRTTILVLDGAAHVTIKKCKFNVPRGSILKKTESSGTKLSLGPGCTLKI